MEEECGDAYERYNKRNIEMFNRLAVIGGFQVKRDAALPPSQTTQPVVGSPQGEIPLSPSQGPVFSGKLAQFRLSDEVEYQKNRPRNARWAWTVQGYLVQEEASDCARLPKTGLLYSIVRRSALALIRGGLLLLAFCRRLEQKKK